MEVQRQIERAIAKAVKAAEFRSAAVRYEDAAAVFIEAAAINSAESKSALDEVIESVGALSPRTCAYRER